MIKDAISVNANNSNKNKYKFFTDSDGFECANYPCPKCGGKMFRVKKLINGMRVDYSCPSCHYIENKDLTKEQKRIEYQARFNACMGYFNHYSVHVINKPFDKNFNNYIPNNSETKKALFVSKRMVNRIIKGNTIHGFLLGSTGVGKTHLACSIVNSLMVHSNYYLKIMFISVDILTALQKQSIDDKEAKDKLNDVLSQLGKSDVVILDDLGTEYNSDWNKDIINRIMELREDKSLIVTSNLKGSADDKNSFDRYSERTLSRLKNHVDDNVVVFNQTEDYRQVQHN